MRRQARSARGALVAALALTIFWSTDAPEAHAQAWISVDQPTSEKIEVKAQYRARTIYIDPLDLSGETVRDMSWTEQRLRLDAKFTQPGVGAFVFQADALDGVLFGDNGKFGQDPSSNAGVSLTSRLPNLTRWEIGLPGEEGENPLDPDSYVPVLRSADLFQINFAYADILLPIGILRIGRQPFNYGPGLAAHDGNRFNRFGVSQYSDSADRVLFGTKIDEAVKMFTQDNHTLDPSLDNGVILAAFYDLLKQDLPQVAGDDLRQVGVAVQAKAAEADWFGFDWTNFIASANVVHLWNEGFNTRAFGFPLLLSTTINDRVYLRAQYVHTRGSTREVSEGFAALQGTEPQQQEVIANGFQGIADVYIGPVTLTLEFDYASGDSDPRSSNAITTFNFARDLNVGLLLFEHVIAFESARSVAVGIENLASEEDLKSFPITEASTQGRFTNAIAIFPQVKVDIMKEEQNEVWVRAGGLFAWPEAGGLIDPIITTLQADGDRIDDDAVNFHGGAPGDYYGTEVDIQLGWKFKKHFEWLIEGAILFPGNSLQDENGDAVAPFFLENRFVLSF